MLLLVVLLPRRLVSGDIVLVRVRDNAKILCKIPFFRLVTGPGAELHLGVGQVRTTSRTHGRGRSAMAKAAGEDPELQLKPEERAELVDRVQRDWKEREFVETIQLNIMQIVSFLNTFDQSARFKLGV